MKCISFLPSTLLLWIAGGCGLVEPILSATMGMFLSRPNLRLHDVSTAAQNDIQESAETSTKENESQFQESQSFQQQTSHEKLFEGNRNEEYGMMEKPAENTPGTGDSRRRGNPTQRTTNSSDKDASHTENLADFEHEGQRGLGDTQRTPNNGEGHHEVDEEMESLRKITCKDQPCGEGQMACRGPSHNGHFACTCMPGYMLYRGTERQPVCVKLELATKVEQYDSPRAWTDGASTKWSIGLTVLGVSLGALLIAAIVWAYHVLNKRLKTENRDVKEEFTGLLGDQRLQCNSSRIRQKTLRERQTMRVERGQTLDSDQLD